MKMSWKIQIASISMIGLLWLGGCAGRTEVVGREPAGYVVVESPGWYYDDAYVGVHGHYHPRTYYYYNGHQWQRHDHLPHGITPHARLHPRGHESHFQHDQHPHHEDRR